jgi:hypothetical protein
MKDEIRQVEQRNRQNKQINKQAGKQGSKQESKKASGQNFLLSLTVRWW